MSMHLWIGILLLIFPLLSSSQSESQKEVIQEYPVVPRQVAATPTFHYQGPETMTATPTFTPTFAGLRPTLNPTGETQTATPTHIPPTATATQGSLVGLFPNVQLQAENISLKYYSEHYDLIAASHINGDLFVLSILPDYRLRIYDGQTLSLKNDKKIFLPPRSGSWVEHYPIYNTAMASNGDFYFTASQYIFRVQNGADRIEIVLDGLSNYDHFSSVLPVMEGMNIPGVEGSGLLFMANHENEQGLFFLPFGESTQPQKIVSFPDPNSYRGKNIIMTLGPNNSLYILDNPGGYSSRIYRLESDQVLIGLQSPFYLYAIQGFAYSHEHNCFFLSGNSGYLYRVSADFKHFLQLSEGYDKPFPTGQIEIPRSSQRIFVAGFYQNRESNTVYTLQITDDEFPTPTNTPTPKPPISNNNPFVTPSPVLLNGVNPLVPYLNLRAVAGSPNYVEKLMIHPKTGELYYATWEKVRIGWMDNGWGINYETRLAIYGPIDPTQGYTPIGMNPLRFRAKSVDYYTYVDELTLDDQGTIYVTKSNGYGNPLELHRLLPDGSTEKIFNDVKHILYVRDSNNALDVPGGSLLLINEAYEFSYFDPAITPYRRVSIPSPIQRQDFHSGIDDLFWGPNGSLYLVERSWAAFYRLDKGQPPRTIEFSNGLTDYVYLEKDQAFYISYYNSQMLCRVVGDNLQSQYILQRKPLSAYRWNPYLLVGGLDGDTLYLYSAGDSQIWALNVDAAPGVPIATPTPTSTPTPQATPTPTPLPMDWLILDGLGGIHTSDPSRRPVLPYLPEFNIFRDLEPDPLGRGWYMLDGFGGVHTSSPELPLPKNLPYFGFDIARDLEIVERDGQMTFLMLDGFGVIHQSGPQEGQLGADSPWFRIDAARDLEPTEDGLGWYVLDAYGAKYDSRDYTISVGAGSYWRDLWLARDLLVLPDGNRMMLDSWGGRHVDNTQNIWSRIKPIPPELYLPGLEIFWDIEVMPGR